MTDGPAPGARPREAAAVVQYATRNTSVLAG
jgi:hypothetical protein